MDKDSLSCQDVEGSSNIASGLHIVCVVAGIGVLGIPYAFNQGGWISIGFVLLSSLMSICTGKILIKCLYYQENGQRLDSYSQIGYHAFGKAGQVITLFFFYTLILTVICLFLMFSGQSFIDAAKSYNILSSITREYYVVLSGIIILVQLLSIKTIGRAQVLSFLGVLMTVVSSLICVIYGYIQLSKNRIHREKQPPSSIANFNTLALSFATIGVSYGGSPLYPTIEQNMKHRKSWNKVLSTSIILISGLYLFIGTSCYYIYQGETQNPVTNNIDSTYLKIWINLIMTIHLLLTAPIALCVFCCGVEDSLSKDYANNTNKVATLRIGIRTVTVSFLALAAIKFPGFDMLMGFMGSSSNCAVTYVLPVFCYLKLTGIRNKSPYELGFLMFVAVIGILTSILGVYDTLVKMNT